MQSMLKVVIVDASYISNINRYTLIPMLLGRVQLSDSISASGVVSKNRLFSEAAKLSAYMWYVVIFTYVDCRSYYMIKAIIWFISGLSCSNKNFDARSLRFAA